MKIRVGIIGWGEIAQQHATQIEAAGAGVSCVVSRRQNLKIGIPVFQSLARMLPHVDAVTVAVPNHLHAPCCLETVRAGKAVMVEKPICITRNELDELEAVLPQAQVPVHLGYRLRWNPSMVTLRKQIRGLKRIRAIYRLGIEHLADGKGWTRNNRTSGGAFFTLGVHMLDLGRWLARAQAEPLTNLQAAAHHRDASTDYPLYATLSGKLPSGVEITAGTDLRADATSKIELTVEAESGGYPDGSLLQPTPAHEDIEFAALFRNFISAVEAGAWDADEFAEVAQTHRELLQAQQLVVTEQAG